MSGLPAGFKVDDPAPAAPTTGGLPAGFTVDAPAEPTGAGPYEARIREAATRHGVDPRVLRSIIQHESNFDPKAHSGLADGIAQFTPDTARLYGINPMDPDQAIDGAARYLRDSLKHYKGDYVKAVASYNAGAPAVDRLGVQGALNQPHGDPSYVQKVLGSIEGSVSSFMGALTKPFTGTAEAATAGGELPKGFRVDGAAVPKPPAAPPPAATKPLAPAKPPPAPVEHSWLEQIGGGLSILQSAAGAIGEGKFDEFLAAVPKGDFAALKEQYGLLSKPSLDHAVASGVPGAQFLRNNPGATAAAQFLLDWIDPVQTLAGHGLGKVLGVGIKYIADTEHGRLLLSAFSPFKQIAANAGEAGKRAMQTMMVKMSGHAGEVQTAALDIFKGLNRDEQFDVVHIHQGSGHAVKTTDQNRLSLLYDRASKLSAYQEHLSELQVGAGTLKSAVAAQRDRYFPLRNAAANTRLTQGKQDFFERLGGRGGGTTPRLSTESTEAEFHSLADMQGLTPGVTGAKGGIRDDWSPIEAFEHWGTQREKRVTFEDTLQKLPTTMVQQMPKRAKGAVALAAPLDGRGREMISPQEIRKNLPELYQFTKNSPGLMKAWLSEDMVQWLRKNSTRLYDDMPDLPKGDDILSKTARTAFKVWDGFNNVTRAAIIANPIYHPLFNLSQNALAAGLPLHQVASLVTKNVLTTIGLGRSVDLFERAAGQTWTKGVAEAWRDGAIADMKVGGEGATRRLAANYKDLGWADRLLKLGDHAQAWNSRNTFGLRGEHAFSVSLYNHLIKQGVDPERAGPLVREALGNYQNVDKNAWQNRVFFFYPWMKGNLPFWVRTVFLNPKVAYAPADAIRRSNALVGDPSESEPGGRAKDYQFTFGDKEHSFGRGSFPGAQKILNTAEGIGSGNPTQMTQAARNLVAGHLQPGLRAAYDLTATSLESAKDPRQPANYNTVFDKNKSAPEQWRQAGAYAAGYVPMPGIGFQARDAIRQGGVDDPGMAALSALTGTNLHRDVPKAEYKQEARKRRVFDMKMARSMNIKDPVKRQQFQDKARAAYDKSILPKPTKKPQSTGSLPAGFTVDSTPSGLPPGFTIDSAAAAP